MPLSSRRPLLQALIVSLAIHGALLLSVADEITLLAEVKTSSLTVVVSRDNQGSPTQRAAAAPAAAPPTAPADPPRTVARAVAAAAIATPKPSSTSIPVPSAPPAAADAGVPAATAPVVAVAAAAGDGVSAPGPSLGGVNADDMRQYRVDLARAARRFKRYPPLAREREWEGTAEVALDFSSVLPAPEVVLARSSGRRVLDEQALAMVAQALHLTALPQGLKGGNFRVLLPVQFSLEDDQ